MIKKLWRHLTKRRKKQFFLLLILMHIASIMEVVSIGAIVPFLASLTSPEQIYQNQLAQPLIQILGITNPNQLLLPLTVIFVIAILISSIVRLLLLYVSTRLTFATGNDLSVKIYRLTLYQDYLTHTSRNSSEIMNGIITKTNIVIGSVLLPLITLVSSVIIMLGIISIVFIINVQVALITFSIFILVYWIIAFFTKRHLQRNSQLIAKQSTQIIKSLQEGLGGIRDVLIDNTQEFYCKLYQNADLPLRRALGNNAFIASSPRYLVEAIGMTLIVVLAYSFTIQKGDFLDAIPVLGALAVAAQKLLPTIQQAYGSYSKIRGAKASFVDVLNLLDQPLPDNNNQNTADSMPFKQDIVFKNLSFGYGKDTPLILKNVNLRFKKGETIGFIGESGIGKSTLLDILMGLLIPTSGELLIDGTSITQRNRKAWQTHISHVPQSIYLADNTIQDNIAFGVVSEKIKMHKVIQAVQQAQLKDVINNLKNKYKTFVGEQGVQLSGGQRQRIGIARALYKDSDVLIFDEATSALDNETEQKIMQQIEQFKDVQTIFIIAHRLTTLKQCDSIIRINKDHIIERIDFNQIGLN
jgi:ATP-binding cassette, subfamily B, bacterial PglK